MAAQWGISVGPLRRALGFWIRNAKDRVSFAPMPAWARFALGCRAGDTAGYIERFNWVDSPAPVEFSCTWFDTSRAHYAKRRR